MKFNWLDIVYEQNFYEVTEKIMTSCSLYVEVGKKFYNCVSTFSASVY